MLRRAEWSYKHRHIRELWVQILPLGTSLVVQWLRVCLEMQGT